MTLPTLPNQPSVGDPTVAGWADEVSLWISFLANPPRLSVYQNASQSVPNTTATAVDFDVSLIDTYGMHSTTVNNSIATVVVPGTYLIYGSIEYPSNATGQRTIDVFVNSSPYGADRADTGALTTGVTTVSILAEIELATNDQVQIGAQQTSGGALNLISGRSSLKMLWVGV